MIKMLEETVSYLENKGFLKPEIGIILGTGLGKLVDEIDIKTEVSYEEIPHFPTATQEFHQGKLVFGKLAGKDVIVMQGRFHLYEDYSLQEVTYPVRVMHKIGIKKLLISNASGAVNLNFRKGELMLIDDHINLQGGSPLAFRGVEVHGSKFTDLYAPYDKEINQSFEQIASKHGITLHKGVYAAVFGPHLETRAEYRFLGIIGADSVGMSTVPEVIVANHLSLPVAAISVLTDECDPDNLSPINIPEIIELAGKAEPKMILLFKELIKTL
ncbi:MAG: purine-nucleoside phosphorylase [Bacteroidia bacterium]|nr:purine-nucleoside phosphorylase [Bacteroidia bacterium]